LYNSNALYEKEIFIEKFFDLLLSNRPEDLVQENQSTETMAPPGSQV